MYLGGGYVAADFGAAAPVDQPHARALDVGKGATVVAHRGEEEEGAHLHRSAQEGVAWLGRRGCAVRARVRVGAGARARARAEPRAYTLRVRATS